ncbi:MAG: glycogen synthase, partial [Candidatus Omnitrophica bacterium]|nr:glycogen synthase [Candidatus Omnitrophota bacterium]
YTNRLYEDDDLKIALVLSDGTLQAIEKLVAWGKMDNPHVINANDWTTALIPTYLKAKYQDHPLFKGVASIYSIHNLAYQGGQWNRFSGSRFNELGIGGEHWFGMAMPEDPNSFNLVRGALYHADEIVTVSKQSADEIQTSEFGEGMHELIASRKENLYGILNGMDVPKEQIMDREQKRAAKILLQREFGLNIDPEVPVIGMAVRIAYQKNVDGALRVMRRMLEENPRMQFVFKGEGHRDDSYTWEPIEIMKQLNRDFPGRVACEYEPGVRKKHSHLVIAASDIYLMPSRREPAGLSQQVALLQGSVVVAHMTGGLIDTVREFNPATGTGNGFTFRSLDDEEFYQAVKRALMAYSDKTLWGQIMRNAQSEDRSWAKATHKYAEVYIKAFLNKKKENIELGITKSEGNFLEQDLLKPFATQTDTEAKLLDAILESLDSVGVNKIDSQIKNQKLIQEAI